MKKDIKFKFLGRVYILPARIKNITIAVVAVAVILIGLMMSGNTGEQTAVITYAPSVSPTLEISPQPTQNATIYVYIVGQVKCPGVYELTSGCMVSHAVEAAGGFSENADREAVNMVEVLTGNTMIKVPAQGESFSEIIISGGLGGSDTGNGDKVNINTAGAEELCTLSGIGESTAKKIISFRETNGNFETIEDIMDVPGIKEAKFLAIKEDICV